MKCSVDLTRTWWTSCSIGIGFSRNFIVATSVDGIIVVDGKIGTLIE